MITIILRIAALLLISGNTLYAQLIINELMPAPIDGEPEWLELYNAGSDKMNISAWTISDAASTKIIPEFTIGSGGYVVICKDTNLLKSLRLIPNTAVVLQSAIPALNNTTDILILKNSAGSVIDSVYYNMNWGEKGLSLERIDWSLKAVNQENWGKSFDINSATPGRFNSISIINYDLICESLKFDKNFKDLTLIIKDSGKQKSGKFSLSLAIDLNSNHIIDFGENVKSFGDLELADKDTNIMIPIDLFTNFAEHNGTYRIYSFINSQTDQRQANDTTSTEIYIRKESPIIKINEFMYDISDDYSEYIEIWNGGSDTLLMDNFLIWDAAGSITKGNIKIISQNFKIAPDDYGVIIWDSTFFKKFPELSGKNNIYYYKSGFNLNLSGDLIVLADFNGRIYDSLTYSDKWHDASVKETKNRSLEKIRENLESSEPSSWSSCAEIIGGTPCRKNSLTSDNTKNGSIVISPNPFAPSSGGADANSVINYELPYLRSQINAKIYDINGFEICGLANNRYSAGIGSLVWDGKNKEGYIVQPGQYILLLEATDSETGNVHQEKAIIVVGK